MRDQFTSEHKEDENPTCKLSEGLQQITRCNEKWVLKSRKKNCGESEKVMEGEIVGGRKSKTAFIRIHRN